jgi:predicted TIM-barrel fold metal-dependent hydrolase
MIIDAHTHLYTNVTREDAAYSLLKTVNKVGSDALIAIMDMAKIDKAIVFPPGISSHANPICSEHVKKYPKRLIGFATVNPIREENVIKCIREAHNLGLKGLKIHPQLQGITLSEGIQNRFEELLNEVAKLRMPVILHSGTPPDTQCLQYDVLAEMFPDVNFIYGHMGLGYLWNDAILSAKKRDNVYLETSGIQFPEAIRLAINLLGSEKVIFGSDLPYLHPDVELHKIMLLGLKEEELEKILSKNILTLLP